ncbi:MAG: hypothetical protein QG622_314 [Actinomycetota bacterium]|nr:hypothetical protein [Actinomycetota bacterium]
MHAEVTQVVAILVVAATWVLAEVYSRWIRRRAERRGAAKLEIYDERPQTIDASALSASDD